MTEPVVVPETATRTELELAQVEARRAELLAQLEMERAAREGLSHHGRALAISLHRALCASDHARLECVWHASPDADDPDRADWTNAAHVFWGAIVAISLAQAEQAGWTVTEPAPLP